MNAPDAVARLAALLALRGTLLLLAGALAIRWPEETVAPAMSGAALVLLISGIYETVLAVRARGMVRAWPLALADGAASIGYGLLTVMVTVVPVRATALLVAIWLSSYATMLLALALGLWPMRRTRQLLLLVGGGMFLVAALAVVYRTTTIFTLVYAGAAFATGLGAFQVAAGLWMRRIAVPYFAPTVQSGWVSAGGAATGSASLRSPRAPAGGR